MTPLALFDVTPIGVELTLLLLGVGVVGTTALAARGLGKAWAADSAPDPWTRFLVAAPKHFGVMALLFGAFAFVMGVEFQALNAAIWFEMRKSLAHSLVLGGAVAVVGFLASWLLEAYAGEEP